MARVELTQNMHVRACTHKHVHTAPAHFSHENARCNLQFSHHTNSFNYIFNYAPGPHTAHSHTQTHTQTHRGREPDAQSQSVVHTQAAAPSAPGRCAQTHKHVAKQAQFSVKSITSLAYRNLYRPFTDRPKLQMGPRVVCVSVRSVGVFVMRVQRDE